MVRSWIQSIGVDGKNASHGYFMVTSWLGHGFNRLESMVKIQVMVTSWLPHGQVMDAIDWSR